MNRRGRVQGNPRSRAWFVPRAACPAISVPKGAVAYHEIETPRREDRKGLYC